MCVCIHSGPIIIIGLQTTAMMSFTSTDPPARLDQHSPGFTLFSLLSLHHYLSASPLESLFPCFFFPLFFSSSLYHLLMPPLSPLLCWLTLFYQLFLCSSSPLAFSRLRTISVFQADVLALLCLLLWLVPLITGNSAWCQ